MILIPGCTCCGCLSRCPDVVSQVTIRMRTIGTTTGNMWAAGSEPFDAQNITCPEFDLTLVLDVPGQAGTNVYQNSYLYAIVDNVPQDAFGVTFCRIRAGTADLFYPTAALSELPRSTTGCSTGDCREYYKTAFNINLGRAAGQTLQPFISLSQTWDGYGGTGGSFPNRTGLRTVVDQYTLPFTKPCLTFPAGDWSKVTNTFDVTQVGDQYPANGEIPTPTCVRVCPDIEVTVTLQ